MEKIAGAHAQRRKRSLSSVAMATEDDNEGGASIPSKGTFSGDGARGSTVFLGKVWTFFDRKIKDYKSAANIMQDMNDTDLDEFITSVGGRAAVIKGYNMDSKSTDKDVYARLRKSLVDRSNNRRRWKDKVGAEPTPLEAVKFKSFGADTAEFQLYAGSMSHLDYLKKSISNQGTDEKFVFLVEGSDTPSVVAAVLLFHSNCLEEISMDTDMVSIFVIHKAITSRKTKLVVPGGSLNIKNPVVKNQLLEVPIICLLGKYNKLGVQTWLSHNGCLAAQLEDSMTQYKVKKAMAETA